MTVDKTAVSPGTTTDFVFTFTASNSGGGAGTGTLAIPSGWTAPKTTAGAGQIVVTTGNCASASLISVVASTINLAHNCDDTQTFTVTYKQATAPTPSVPPQSYTFNATPITAGSSPVVTVTAPACIAPSITTAPSAQSVTVGDPVSFSVSATGTGPLGYQWQKNGSGISRANSPTYAIPSAVSSDASTYRVVVTNTCGSTTSSGAVLTVARATSVVSWAPPAAITYGTALTNLQLNATADHVGTFDYTPAAGSVLNAGTRTLSVTFTPTNSADFTTETKTVSLVVTKAALTVSSDNQTKYGEADPALTASMSGFKGTDARADATTGRRHV